MNKDRKDELAKIAIMRLQDYINDDFFKYQGWDDKIECEMALTESELDWMRDHILFNIKVDFK